MTTAYDKWTKQHTWTLPDGTRCTTWKSDRHRVEFFFKRPAIGCVQICVSYADRGELCVRTGGYAYEWLNKWTQHSDGHRRMREAYTEQVNLDTGWHGRPHPPTIFDDIN